MTEKEITEVMQSIRVSTFAAVTENGHIGCIERSDGAWRIYIGVDGMPKDLHISKDQNGELLGQAIRESLSTLVEKRVSK